MKPGSLGTNFPDRVSPTAILGTISQEIEQGGLGENYGPSAPRMFGNGAQEYFEKYGGGIEHLAKIGTSILMGNSNLRLTLSTASKNHKHSMNNPYSQFRDGWSVEQVLNSTKITNQLTKFMCSPTSVNTYVFLSRHGYNPIKYLGWRRSLRCCVGRVRACARA